MAGEIPSGEGSVFHFFDIYALGFGLEACGALFLRKSWGWVALGIFGSIFFHLLGTKWPKIKSHLWPHLSSTIDRIANDRRYHKASYFLVVGCFFIAALAYVRQIRSDLDTYVMPRTVTAKQAGELRKYLSPRDKYPVTILYNSFDPEATSYATQLVDALVKSGWDARPDNSGTPQTVSTGLCFGSTGAEPSDVNHNPRWLLDPAFHAADIECRCARYVGNGDYKFFLVVGQRPLAIGDKEPILSKLGRWIARKANSD